jgi:hypothetical protein
MDDFSTPGIPNGFGLRPSPCPHFSIYLLPCLPTHPFPPVDNYPEPGKRPLSSIIPTIIEHANGSFYLSVGGSGGSGIFPAVYQVILNLDWGSDVSQAVEYGRLHDQLYPLVVQADDSYPADLLNGLVSRGHNVTSASLPCEDTVLFRIPFDAGVSLGRQSRRCYCSGHRSAERQDIRSVGSPCRLGRDADNRTRHISRIRLSKEWYRSGLLVAGCCGCACSRRNVE